MKWKADDMPDQSEKVVIITGANSGLGFESTKALLRKNATVIMACRSIDKAENALNTIREEITGGNAEIIKLDLGSFESITEFVDQFKSRYDRLDILMNNAGLMAIPQNKTKSGFEMQIGVNHFGHYVLTGKLLDYICTTPNSRVVTLSSNYHKQGDIRLNDINFENTKYKKWDVYAQSKLANLLFALELQRKFDEHKIDSISVGAHPGYASTGLQTKGPEMSGSGFMKFMMKIANFLFAQSAEKGALPQLYAATAEVEGGDYIGPGGLMEMRGHPEKVEPTEKAKDEQLAKDLWKLTEELTNMKYDFTA